MTERCEGCRWWAKGGYYGVGECRRFPPDHGPMGNVHQGGDFSERRWPKTRDDDWCGEWQARPESRPKETP